MAVRQYAGGSPFPQYRTFSLRKARSALPLHGLMEQKSAPSGSAPASSISARVAARRWRTSCDVQRTVGPIGKTMACPSDLAFGTLVPLPMLSHVKTELELGVELLHT